MPYPVIPDVPIATFYTGGTNLIPVPAATPTVVKATPGRLNKVIITTLGATPQVFYDNPSAASGAILFSTVASAPVGTVYTLDEPVLNGIYAQGLASTPACSVVIT